MNLRTWSKLGLLCFAAFLATARADETCTWKADGSKVCDEDDAMVMVTVTSLRKIFIVEHNVWKDTDDWEWEDETELKKEATSDDNSNRNPEASQDFNELELELYVQFFKSLVGWSPRGDDLEKHSPEIIIAAVMDTWDVFDKNDDGFLEYSLPFLTYIEYLDFVAIPRKSITIDEYFIFQITDTNKDGLLSEDEYLVLMKGIATKIQVDMRDDEDVLKEFHKLDLNEAELLNPEEIKAVFDNLIPAPPPAQVKRITEAFNVFDADGDGVWRIVFERTGNHTTIYGQIFWSKIGCPHINEYAR